MRIYHSSKNNKYTTLTITHKDNSIFLTLTSGYKNSKNYDKITIKLDTSEVAYIKEVLSKYLGEMIEYEDKNYSNRDYSNY